MTTKKYSVSDPKTIAVPGALRKKLGNYANDREIHIYEVVEKAWNALMAAENAHGTGTPPRPVALPQALSVDTVGAIAEAESLLSGAVSVLRKIRESADGNRGPNQDRESDRTTEEVIRIAETLAPETGGARGRPVRGARKQPGNKTHPVGDEARPGKLKELAG